MSVPLCSVCFKPLESCFQRFVGSGQCTPTIPLCCRFDLDAFHSCTVRSVKGPVIRPKMVLFSKRRNDSECRCTSSAPIVRYSPHIQHQCLCISPTPWRRGEFSIYEKSIEDRGRSIEANDVVIVVSKAEYGKNPVWGPVPDDSGLPRALPGHRTMEVRSSLWSESCHFFGGEFSFGLVLPSCSCLRVALKSAPFFAFRVEGSSLLACCPSCYEQRFSGIQIATAEANGALPVRLCQAVVQRQHFH